MNNPSFIEISTVSKIIQLY